MKAGEFSFILTAAHTAQEFDGRMLVTMCADQLIEVTGRRIGYKPLRNERIDTDLAVVELTSQESEAVAERFSFTLLEDVADVTAQDKLVLYATVGYPFSRNKPRPPNIGKPVHARPMYITSKALAELPYAYSADKHERVHFALSAPADKMMNVSLSQYTLPKPQGMSGGGVWRIDLDRTSGALASPRIVGVAIEHIRQNETFVATRIGYVLPLLRDLRQLSQQRPGA